MKSDHEDSAFYLTHCFHISTRPMLLPSFTLALLLGLFNCSPSLMRIGLERERSKIVRMVSCRLNTSKKQLFSRLPQMWSRVIATNLTSSLVVLFIEPSRSLYFFVQSTLFPLSGSLPMNHCRFF